jgi:PEP-CTERM motif
MQRNLALSAAIVAIGIVLGAPGQALAASFTFQDIINSNDVTFNQELGINSFGTIAGYFGSGAMGHPNQGYTVVAPYAQPNFTNENFPGSVQTQVTGINNIGTTVGFWSNQNNASLVNNNFGFVDIANTFRNVNNPATGTGPAINQLLGVNNSNVAVGFYVDGAGATHGYTYDIAAMTFSPNLDDPHGIGATTAAAINNSGVIAGFYLDSMGISHGFIDNGGTFSTIDPTGSMSTMLLGLNDNGLAVGTYIDAMNVMHGLLYNLNNNTFQNIDDPNGIGTTTINGINDLNQLVGFYVNGNDNTIGLLANPVPEPSSWAMMLIGFAGLGFALRQSRRKVSFA